MKYEEVKKIEQTHKAGYFVYAKILIVLTLSMIKSSLILFFIKNVEEKPFIHGKLASLLRLMKKFQQN